MYVFDCEFCSQFQPLWHLQRDHSASLNYPKIIWATSGQSRVVYLARLNTESKLAEEVEYDDVLSKPFLRRHEKCFWSNRDICTNFWNYKVFAHYFKLSLAGFSLRSLRIEMQLRMRETSDAWIRRDSVKKFQMVHILKNMKSLLPSFFKNLDDNFFFTSCTEPNWKCFEDF